MSIRATSPGIGLIGNEQKPRSGPLTKTTTYTLTVTNALGESITAQATVTVVPLPTITSFKPVLTPIATCARADLVAEFSFGTGVIQPGGWVVVSGTPVGTGGLTTTTT